MQTVKGWECHLSPHDFLFYVSHEVRLGMPEPYINNSALLYAFNTHLEIHRNASVQKPHYEEDRSKFEIYSTPALIEESMQYSKEQRSGKGGVILIGNNEFYWKDVSREMQKITYNSVHEKTLTTEDQNVNLPAMGKYLKFKPLTPFKCYVFGGKGPAIIRLGKKLTPVRVLYKEILLKKENGKFSPSHPVNILELPKTTKIIDGKIIYMPPWPLLIDGKLDGNYLINEETKTIIAEPDWNLYTSVKLA
ncbi:MAG: type I-D CRISPR-associated protein Cas5/Csc1 [Thermoplasmata archaeon]